MHKLFLNSQSKRANYCRACVMFERKLNRLLQGPGDQGSRSEKNSPSLISNLLTPETRLLETTHLKFRVTPTGLLDLATRLGVSPNLS